MTGWPKRFHPARVKPVPAGFDDDGAAVHEDRLVVDSESVVAGYQVQPGTWEGCAQWCGGTQVVYPSGDRGVAVGSLDPGRVALLGDFVMQVGPGSFEVSRADGHYQRWAATEPDPA